MIRKTTMKAYLHNLGQDQQIFFLIYNAITIGFIIYIHLLN